VAVSWSSGADVPSLKWDHRQMGSQTNVSSSNSQPGVGLIGFQSSFIFIVKVVPYVNKDILLSSLQSNYLITQLLRIHGFK